MEKLRSHFASVMISRKKCNFFEFLAKRTIGHMMTTRNFKIKIQVCIKFGLGMKQKQFTVHEQSAILVGTFAHFAYALIIITAYTVTYLSI